MLRLQVPNSRSKSHRVLARVLHVTPQGKDQWLLGCTFLGELSDRELQSFLE